MTVGESNRFGVSGSTLKLLACVFMAIDHVGVRLFPHLIILRIIGRLAFPMFAFFIAEGCRYTRNKLRHFLMIFAVGVAYCIFYFIYADRFYGNIFMTFSVSILLIYLLQWCKKSFFDRKPLSHRILSVMAMLSGLIGTYVLFSFVHFEYGYLGMLLPVTVALVDADGCHGLPEGLRKPQIEHAARITLLTLGCLLLCINANLGSIQFFSLLAIPFLALYNGTVGVRKLKYFFYLFYPVHLLIIEGIALLMKV